VIQQENKNILCELEYAQIKMEHASINYKLQVESTLQHNNLIRSERQRFWDTVQQTKEKGNIKLEKESQGYEAIISHMQDKHAKEVNRLKEGIKHNETLIATNELKYRAGELQSLYLLLLCLILMLHKTQHSQHSYFFVTLEQRLMI
jgi:hypothetical protein